MQTRAEHLEWCKQRASEYCNRGDAANALTSMFSDLGKHPETAGHIGIEMGVMMMLSGMLSTTNEAQRFIDGFN